MLLSTGSVSELDRAPVARRYVEPKRKSAERLTWVDTLRGCAILLVILLHATLIAEPFGKTPWQPLVYFNYVFSPYRMAILMFVSGLLLANSLKKPAPEYAIRKIATLLYPYLLWTVCYGFLINPRGLGDVWLWIGGSYLWFILFLFTYYIVAMMLSSVPPSVLVLASFALSLLAPDDTKYIERYLFLLGFFFLGHYISGRPTILDRITSPRALIVTLPITIGFSIYSTLNEGINYQVEYVVPTLAGLIVLGCLARHISRLKWSKPLNFMGRHSVVFFVLHYPLVYFVVSLGLMSGLTAIPALTTIAFVVSLCACWGAALFRQKFGFSEYLYSVPIKTR